MTFRSGQKVVCTDADQAPMLTLSHIYTIRTSLPPMECRWKGVVGKWATVWLYEVEPQLGCHGFCAERFQPYDDRKTDISVFKEILINTPEHVWYAGIYRFASASAGLRPDKPV